MKRALGIVAVVVGVVTGTGCVGRGSEESGNAVPLPEAMPLCADQFQDGKTIEEPDFGLACRTATDELNVPRYVRLSCADDRTLVWNDHAWGYVGGPMQLFDANATVRIPADQAVDCRQNATNSSIQGTVGDAP